MRGVPIVLFCGKSGSGKDTASEFWGGTRIALADPIKRLVISMLDGDYCEGILWGDSAGRNKSFVPDHQRRLHTFLRSPGEIYHFVHAWAREEEVSLDDGVVNVTEIQWKIYGSLKKPDATYRSLLQDIGSAFRDANPDFWVDKGIADAMKVLAGTHVYEKELGCYPPNTDKGQSDWVTIPDGRYRNEILAVKRAGGRAIQITRDAPSPTTGTLAQHHSETSLNNVPEFWYDWKIPNDRDLDAFKRSVTSACQYMGGGG